MCDDIGSWGSLEEGSRLRELQCRSLKAGISMTSVRNRKKPSMVSAWEVGTGVCARRTQR